MIQFLLRLPDDMHAELKAWAKRESRSLHAHILYILQKAIKEWGNDNG